MGFSALSFFLLSIGVLILQHGLVADHPEMRQQAAY